MTDEPRDVVYIGNKKMRLPFDRHDLEAIAKRIDALLFSPSVDDQGKVELEKLCRGLRKCDDFLSRVIGDQPLPTTELRPARHNEDTYRSSPLFGENQVMVRVGFVYRVDEHVCRLEARAAFDEEPLASAGKPLPDISDPYVQAVTIAPEDDASLRSVDIVAEWELENLNRRIENDEI
jgi:hypothetical protein